MSEEDGRYGSTNYPVRLCTQDDFGHTEIAIKNFKSWAGGTWSVLCPDMGEESFKLEGDTASMLSRNF